MEDQEFDDLLAGVDMFPASSQELLTYAAAELDIFTDADASQSTAPSSIAEQNDEIVLLGSAEKKRFQYPQRLLATEALSITACGSTPQAVRDQIENIFSNISDALTSSDGRLCLTIKTRPTTAQGEARLRHIRFPGRTTQEAWRFTVIMRLMELIHHAICTDVVLSKRDIYYRDPALFGAQAVVDRYVDNIAYTFRVPRSMLHVTAAAKGLVSGAFSICRRDGTIMDARSNKDGLLVPMLRDVLSIDMSALKWILVVEKEASFRSIAASTFWDEVSNHGVIITGKGYPDIATRALLHFMSMASPQNGFARPPVFCLVDFDPDGLEIMSTYRNGSAAMAHENENLCVPRMQWLALQSEHLTVADELHSDQGLLVLTARDRRKAVSMLERTQIDSEEHERDVGVSLQTMLMLNKKAELQLLDASPHGMVDLLTSALSELE